MCVCRSIPHREIDEAAKAKGAHSIDAPVSGGDVGAKNAALSIMVCVPIPGWCLW
jgi:3-hydroxyisobutyrate dehydrogenase-like beta-hydroxyacid dehydrogenase